MKKAQMSLEFLLLLLIFLALLSISLYSLAGVRKFAEDELHKDSMRRMLAKISYFSDEICILGEGNVRAVRERNLGDFRLLKNGEHLKMISGGFEISEKMPCRFDVFGSDYSEGEAVLSMEGGIARISPG